jgi:hypothetical protein
MTDHYCIETGYASLNKHGEILCGDHIETTVDESGSAIIVLADGLGSGVKACILSTLTSKILSTMMAHSMPMEECISTIASTLPICKVRELAYSTFTIIRITDHREAEIIQYDNPNIIMLRDGKNFNYPVISEIIDGKKILKSKVTLQENDVFVAMSDGVLHAGVGGLFDFGWAQKEVTEFLEKLYNPKLNARTFSTTLLDMCSTLYEGEPGDDTSVCTVKIRKRKQINLLIGPPEDPDDVAKMMSLFFSKEGKHIVCGGTTSTLASEHLGQRLRRPRHPADGQNRRRRAGDRRRHHHEPRAGIRPRLPRQKHPLRGVEPQGGRRLADCADAVPGGDGHQLLRGARDESRPPESEAAHRF